MTPEQFLSQIKQREPGPAYLFLGPEQFRRDWCVKALIERVLPDEAERENGLVRRDLGETSLAEVLDEAACGSLFAERRLILATNAEAALPRGRSAASEDDDGGAPKGAEALARFMHDPPPGVVVVFEATRYGFQGEDKKKSDRIRKFYEAVPAVVEFEPMSASQARQAAEKHARRVGLNIGAAELDLLIESLGADAARVASEIEKLALYAGDRAPGPEEIAELVPEARESTTFALVAALGRNDRAGSLAILDTLIQQSEYLPLALSFLATQFRLALAAREAGLKSPRDIQLHFQKLGVPMWMSRAQQVSETASRFTKKKLARGLETIYSADKALRDARPDDRVVMEEFVMRLTGA